MLSFLNLPFGHVMCHKNLGPIGSAILTFIEYKQTNKQTHRQPRYIEDNILDRKNYGDNTLILLMLNDRMEPRLFNKRSCKIEVCFVVVGGFCCCCLIKENEMFKNIKSICSKSLLYSFQIYLFYYPMLV